MSYTEAAKKYKQLGEKVDILKNEIINPANEYDCKQFEKSCFRSKIPSHM